jgi:carboxylesterase type B
VQSAKSLTVRCRLGTFGFFVGPEGSGLAGNYALSDIVSALEWVKKNIAV